MISSSDFTCSSRTTGSWSGDRPVEPGGTPPRWTPTARSTTTRAAPLAASGQSPWPPAGSSVTAYGQNLMAADMRPPPPRGNRASWTRRSAERLTSRLYGEVDLERDDQLRADRQFSHQNR